MCAIQFWKENKLRKSVGLIETENTALMVLVTMACVIPRRARQCLQTFPLLGQLRDYCEHCL